MAVSNFIKPHPGVKINADAIDIWSGRLLMFLAVASFVLSYAGMYAVAQSAGYGWLTWLWPLVTETGIVIFSLVYLAAHLNGYQNRLLMPLIVGCTVLSVIFNVWHAPPDLLTQAVVALPPLFLFAAFKTWIWKIEQDVKRAATVASLDELTEQADKLTRRRDQLAGECDRLEIRRDDLKSEAKRANVEEMNRARHAKIERRRERVLHLSGEGMTQAAIASELNVSEATIKRDLKALNGRVSP